MRGAHTLRMVQNRILFWIQNDSFPPTYTADLKRLKLRIESKTAKFRGTHNPMIGQHFVDFGDKLINSLRDMAVSQIRCKIETADLKNREA
jgi:hypothetical protein